MAFAGQENQPPALTVSLKCARFRLFSSLSVLDLFIYLFFYHSNFSLFDFSSTQDRVDLFFKLVNLDL